MRPVARYELPFWPGSLAIDNKGNAYVVGGSSAVKIALESRQTTVLPGHGGIGSRFEITAGDRLWGIGYGGAVRLSDDGTMIASYAAPSQDWYPVPFTEDREGNIWVGYDFGKKLYKYSPDGTRLLDLPVVCGRGLVIDSKGNVVAGAANAVTWLAPDGSVLQRFPLGKNFNGFGIDANDNVWAGEQDDTGTIYRLTPTGETRSFNPTNQKKFNFRVGRNGDIWFTSEMRGRSHPMTLFRMGLDGTLLGSADLGPGVNTYEVDQAGFVWVGYASTAPVADTKDYHTGFLVKMAVNEGS